LQFTFTVVPSSPVANQQFQIRVELGNLGCVPLPDALSTTGSGGNVIRYELHVPDSCFPFPPQARTYSVAPLPAGNYTFQYVYCPHANPPQPDELCSTISEQTVTVVAPDRMAL